MSHPLQRRRTWIDTADLKRRHPIADVVARCGVRLRPSGRALVGRCPFHEDSGRPNLHIYPDTARWWCYRCGVGGDAIDFVMAREGLGFLDACAFIAGGVTAGAAAAPLFPVLPSAPHPAGVSGTAARACLAAAVEVYHHRLLRDPAALAYCAGRGLDRDLLARCRVGFVTGGELAPALRERGLSPGAAMDAGLLDRCGRDRLAGRIVIPEIRAAGPLWLIGRAAGERGPAPKYLSLPGRKPLLGWQDVRESDVVFITEGPFDRLALAGWGFPALALAGTRARPDVLRALARFACVYLVLDSDPAGREATTALWEALGPRALPVQLPQGVKDIADLALLPHGRAAFTHAVRAAAGLAAGDAHPLAA